LPVPLTVNVVRAVSVMAPEVLAAEPVEVVPEVTMLILVNWLLLSLMVLDDVLALMVNVVLTGVVRPSVRVMAPEVLVRFRVVRPWTKWMLCHCPTR